MRSNEEIELALRKYGDMIKRVCVVYLKNREDTEDVFQNVFLKYAQSSAVFESAEHEKAWFLRVSINACKDWLRAVFRRRTVPLEEVLELPAREENENREVLEAVLGLSEKYREAVYLHYFEGYTARGTAEILRKNPNTVYTLLNRAREMLRERLGDDGD